MQLAADHILMPVVALRLPGLYGLGDRLIVDPLLEGTMSAAPSGGPAVVVDFCFVENAAHAHCVAVDALLRRPESVAGRVFNVSDDDPRPPLALWNELLRVCKPEAAQVGELPLMAAYSVACLTEAVDWLFSGRVPFPKHPVWSLTRASVGL